MWNQQLLDFIRDMDAIEFDAGYKPEGHERFKLDDFELPIGLAGENSNSVINLPSLADKDAGGDAFHALAAFARTENAGEFILFQNFIPSHLIKPGRSLFLSKDTYRGLDTPLIVLDTKLAAVYVVQKRRLLFSNFRITNTFLPLHDYYQEASEEEILSVLSHKKFAPEDPKATAQFATQWARKRFALLRDSNILEEHSVKKIVKRSKALGVDIEIDKSNGTDRIVFPVDKMATKILLQCLVEQRYRGHITDTLFETNSKKAADQ